MNTKINPQFLYILILFSAMLGFFGCAHQSKMEISAPEKRAEAVDAYLAEFSAPSFTNSNIGPAIRDVLMRIPEDALKTVMDRRRPVMFVDFYSSGTAQFASSAEVIVTRHDKPAFQEGMTLIKISDVLDGGTPEAIKGIVVHEIAHRVLDHIRTGHVSCQAEREANRLIKSWGFVQEFEGASEEFGKAKTGDNVASCQEAPQTKPSSK